jgi:hypothetical protein
MTMVRSETVIRKEGMEYLLEKLGVLDTEVFISGLLRDRFDYTEWQREYFSKYSADDFLTKAVEYDKLNPVKIK